MDRHSFLREAASSNYALQPTLVSLATAEGGRYTIKIVVVSLLRTAVFGK
jgi:hypothetical protein